MEWMRIIDKVMRRRVSIFNAKPGIHSIVLNIVRHEPIFNYVCLLLVNGYRVLKYMLIASSRGAGEVSKCFRGVTCRSGNRFTDVSNKVSIELIEWDEGFLDPGMFILYLFESGANGTVETYRYVGRYNGPDEAIGTINFVRSIIKDCLSRPEQRYRCRVIKPISVRLSTSIVEVLSMIRDLCAYVYIDENIFRLINSYPVEEDYLKKLYKESGLGSIIDSREYGRYGLELLINHLKYNLGAVSRDVWVLVPYIIYHVDGLRVRVFLSEPRHVSMDGDMVNLVLIARSNRLTPRGLLIKYSHDGLTLIFPP